MSSKQKATGAGTGQWKSNNYFINYIIIIVTLLLSQQALILVTPLSSSSATTSLCRQSGKVLIRQIRQHPSNVTYALNILSQIDTNINSNNNNDNNKITPIDRMHNIDELNNVAVEVLRVCENANKHNLALELYKKYPSETARTAMISVLGRCNQITKAIELLEDDDDDIIIGCTPSTASYNAAIAACGKIKDWELALDIYHNKIPKERISSLTTNALLTILSKCRKGIHSLEIFENMNKQIPPSTPTNNNNNNSNNNNNNTSRTRTTTDGTDSVTYTLVISSLVRSNMVLEASQILEELENNRRRQHYCSRKSIESMYDLVLSAYSQQSDWSSVERLERMRDRKIITSNGGDDEDDSSEYRFQQWEGLTKVDKGKESYWIIGTYQSDDNNNIVDNSKNNVDNNNNNSNKLNITVGTRPHRNPARNGIQIIFFENVFDEETKTWKQNKLGYLLMKNNSYDRTSSMLGMFLTQTERGRGISKICLSIWILLCLDASLLPVTGIINKPLLALILQHAFGFVSPSKNKNNNGVLVELSQDLHDPTCVVLYSSSKKCLEGAFSPSDRIHQNIKIISQQPPAVRGRIVRIGSKLKPSSDLKHLRNTCEEMLSIEEKYCWKCNLSCEEIQRIFLGKTLK
ncbi:MAG: pentatricopeptide repeat protein [Bacillariaceae sp.]|jgi:pentatricopeptide repeat protein